MTETVSIERDRLTAWQTDVSATDRFAAVVSSDRIAA